MTEDDVVGYLQSHPDLLAKYLKIFENDIDKQTNRDEKIISLSHRQVPQLQQKIRSLEEQINEFLINARRNEKSWDSLLKASLTLFKIKREDVSIKLIESKLHEQFSIEVCRIFTVSRHVQQPNHEKSAILNFLGSVDGPRCLLEPPQEIEQLVNSWVLASSAYIPISSNALLGVLIFSSSDENKYDPSIDTRFLEKIGNVVSATLEYESHRDITV